MNDLRFGYAGQHGTVKKGFVMKTMTWPRWGFLMALVVAAAIGCGNGGGSDDDSTSSDDDAAADDDVAGQVFDVDITGFAFDPSPITIAVGDTVVWTNQDAVGHTVTSGNPGDGDAGSVFDSATLGNGDSFSFTFDTAGDYVYFCRPHAASMNGAHVIVE